jgi:hypothetical protein
MSFSSSLAVADVLVVRSYDRISPHNLFGVLLYKLVLYYVEKSQWLIFMVRWF